MSAMVLIGLLAEGVGMKERTMEGFCRGMEKRRLHMINKFVTHIFLRNS